ncbi:MAG: hypothetical protein ACQSGP_14550 [Frankia sp.]
MLYSGNDEKDKANLEFRNRVLRDARDLTPELRLAMEALIETGTVPATEFRTLTLTDLAPVVSHPAVAVVVLNELQRDPRAFEPAIAESNGRLAIVAGHRGQPGHAAPPQFTDLTENIAYHAARYLRRVEARGDGHPDLTAIRRPLEPIALRVLPDRAAVDDVLARLDQARSAPRNTGVGIDSSIASRAQACADAVLALAAIDRRRPPS